MSEKPTFAIPAIAVALASVAEATTLDRNSAARAKSKTLAAATSLKKADSAEDRLLQKIMNICLCSDIAKGQLKEPRDGERDP